MSLEEALLLLVLYVPGCNIVLHLLVPLSRGHSDDLALVGINDLLVAVNLNETVFLSAAASHRLLAAVHAAGVGTVRLTLRFLGARFARGTYNRVDAFVQVIQVSLTNTGVLVDHFLNLLHDGRIQIALPLHMNGVTVSELVAQKFRKLFSRILLVCLRALGRGSRLWVHFINSSYQIVFPL